ncbi:MAG: transglycosylase SLT domain-containing protein [Candidatus Woesearchaeota archaeon]
MKRGILEDKKGEDILDYNVIFIILNLVIFSLFLYFVYDAASGAVVYEQAYAKEIALLIDSAKPDMEIRLNFSEGFEIAEENQKTGSLVSVNGNILNVNVGKREGYSIEHFSDYDVSVEEKKSEGLVVLNVREKIFESGNDFDYVVTLDQLENAILYARDNLIIDRTCQCELDCDKFPNTCCEKYAEWIYHYSQDFEPKMNPLLVLAQMIQESQCDQNVNSGSGAFGLMQITNNPESLTFDYYCKDKQVGDIIFKDFKDVQGQENAENNIACGRKVLEGKYKENIKGSDSCGYGFSGINSALRGYAGWNCNIHPTYVSDISDKYSKLKESGVEYVASK